MSIRITAVRHDAPEFTALPAGKGVDPQHLAACLVALDGTRVTGRIALYLNPEIRHHDAITALAGHFACEEAESGTALLAAACAEAASRGAAFLLGPMDGSTWNGYRFITAGHSGDRFITEMCHPAWYPRLWEACGFRSAARYVSNLAAIRSGDCDTSVFSRNDLRARSIATDELGAELRHVYPLCSAAFAGNPYYSSISETAFVEKLLPLKNLLAASLTRIVEDRGGTARAFILCLPDSLRKDGKRLVVKTAAKDPGCGAPGLITVLNQQIMNDAAAAGFTEVVHAFMHLDNRSVSRSREFSGRIIREYALFVKALR